MAEMKTFNGYEVVDAKARQDIASHDTRITEVEKFFEAADANGVIDKLVEVQKYIEDDAKAAAELVESIADVDAKVDAIHVPENVSELNNDSGYLTEHQSLDNYYTKAQTDSAINEAVNSIEIPEVDLTPYAKVADMPTKVSQLENDSGYLTEHQSLDGYALKTDIPEVPTKVSELENDVGYLTEHQDLSEYAKKSELPSVEGLASEEFVIKKIAEAELPDQDVDLSVYYTKSETEAAIKTAVDAVEIPDVSGLATKEEVAAVDAKIPSLDGYATEQYVDDAIAAIDIPEGDGAKVVFIDASSLTITTSVPDDYVDIFRKYYTGECRDYIFYIKFVTDSAYQQSINVFFGDNSLLLYGAVTETSSNKLLSYRLNIRIGDTLTWAKHTDTDIDIPEGGDVDLSNYYTKEETDIAIHNSKDTYYLDFSNSTEENQPATEDMIEFASRWLEGQNVCAHVLAPVDGANPVNGYQAVTVQKSVGNMLILKPNGIDPAVVSTTSEGTYYSFIINNNSTDGWIYRRHKVYQFAIATTDYATQAIAALEARVAALEGNN